MKKLHEWESVGTGIHRAAVPGGWLYREAYWTEGPSVFVPDPDTKLVAALRAFLPILANESGQDEEKAKVVDAIRKALKNDTSFDSAAVPLIECFEKGHKLDGPEFVEMPRATYPIVIGPSSPPRTARGCSRCKLVVLT